MTVNELIYHLAALARDGKGGCVVELWDRHDGEHPLEHVVVRRHNHVPPERVRFIQDYTETVELT